MKENREDRGPGEEGEFRTRKILEVAALETSGEFGHRELTVQRITNRAGLDRRDFYRWFDSAEACYAAAYEEVVEEIMADMISVVRRQEGWLRRMRAALASLGETLAAEPLLARGIFIEVHVAGGRAAAKRDEVFERLSRAVDSARREIVSRHSPPPITARLILSMVEATVVKAVMTAEPALFAKAIPDLLYVAVSFYFGPEKAQAELG